MFGFGSTLAVLLCFGSGESTSPPQTSSSDGRYRMFSPPQASGGVPDIFVIDTQSGRIWRKTFYSDLRASYMVPQAYLSADGHKASAVPSDAVSSESQTLQSKYDEEFDQVRQKKSEK